MALTALAPLALAALAPFVGAGCTDKPARALGFDVAFACDEVRSAASSLRIEIRKDGCDGELVRSIAVVRGGEPAADGALDAGKYGLVARALDDGGEELGRGCVVANLPADYAPSVIVDSALCSVPGGDAGDVADDAARPECPPSCADPDPCTDDSCVNGKCVNTPFDGARECDGIACTTGDRCVAGTCNPGTPDNGQCQQPSDQCQRATCIAGSGCNVGNAEGASCNDGIRCTDGDTCSAGVCRGTSTCASNQVCRPSTGECIGQCTSPSDCDDADPCTNDLCNSGTCSNPPNTGASCDDGNACTANDKCANGVCTGTSTCPQGASCVGSVCDCPPDTTLCGNACVDLNSSRSSCGVCGRACTGTQTCQGGACKPTTSDASQCTSARNGGHDYLFCSDNQSWGNARNKCASWGFGLVVVDSAAENSFVRSGLGARDAWLGANDSSNTSRCRLEDSATGEGHWYWASATDSNLTDKPLCDVNESGPVSCAAVNGAYQNWASGQPDNSGCTCALGVCTFPSGDCGVLQAAGTWDDTPCGNTRAYVCESP
jgi:Lectin C-type domain